MRQRRKRAPIALASPDWERLLVDAVCMPGVLSGAYQRFWNYSVGNQLLAWFECLQRGLDLGSINTFRGWQELGRQVKRGEKAISLCMPVTVKAKTPSSPIGTEPQVGTRGKQAADQDAIEAPGTKTVFVYRARWFVLSQTEGAPYVHTELPQWSESSALRRLGIKQVSFSHPNGNCQGYAKVRQVAVSPVAEHPQATLFHEIAHVVLGHTSQRVMEDFDRTPRHLQEVEAECVALIICETLNLPGIPECRGYIQYWLKGQTIPADSARKIFKAADAILKAGYPEKSMTSSDKKE